MSRTNYHWIKRKYGDALISPKALELTPINTEKYELELIGKSKYIALKLANTLIHKNYTGASIAQLTSALVNVNAMLRLEQGKSTENIAHRVLHDMNPKQLALIKDAVMNLKKSMLNS